MKRQFTFLALLTLASLQAQNLQRFGFLEPFAGIGTVENNNAVVYGAGYHYIYGRNIYSLKYTRLSHVKYGFLLSKETRSTIDDLAAMYGRNWQLSERGMFTASGGISYSAYQFTDYTPIEYELEDKDGSIGFPIEVSFRLFSANLSRSNSFGFKAGVTLSRHSFGFIGISYGFGSKRNEISN